MKSSQFKSVFLALFITVLVSSCGKNQEKSSNTDTEFDAANENKKKVATDISKMLEDMPPPSEVPYLLMSAGANYDATMLNSLDKVDSYQNNENKVALNLGIYATDIAYLASYEQSDIALNYMGECQKLAAPIGVASALDYGIVSRFEANIGNKDSLSFIINELIKKSGKRLSELNELNSAALLLIGSWVEGIYLSTEIVKKYPNELPERSRTLILDPLVRIVIEQKTSLNDLLKLINDVPGSEEISNMETELQKIKSIYDNEFAEVENQISENTGGLVLSPNILDNLSSEVTKIRTSIIE